MIQLHQKNNKYPINILEFMTIFFDRVSKHLIEDQPRDMFSTVYNSESGVGVQSIINFAIHFNFSAIRVVVSYCPKCHGDTRNRGLHKRNLWK